MAIIYGDGKAGQHAKRTAHQYYKRIMFFPIIVIFMAGLNLGLLLVLAMPRWRIAWAWPLFAIEVVLALAAFWGTRRADKYMDKLTIERIKWLRGGQAEALVAWYFNSLPNTWHVFHNVKIWKSGDLDHVLVGPPGLFCISTKSNRGLYTTNQDGKYFLNGEETDHVHQAQRLTMQLKDKLAELLGSVPWIQPVLIAPFAWIEFPTVQPRAMVMHEGNLVEAFFEVSRKLDQPTIEKCANAVKMVADKAAEL